MLGNLLKSIYSASKNIGSARKKNDIRISPYKNSGIEILSHQTYVQNLNILYNSILIGKKSYYELFCETLFEVRMDVPSDKWYRRSQRALHLIHYYLHSFNVAGARAECGVCFGFSALLLCKAKREQTGRYDGEDFYLLDSFEGLSEITKNDVVIEESGGSGSSIYSKGDMRAEVESVRNTMQDFPKADILKGWIPDIFAKLPETNWAFLHIDVDLYDPTFAALEYFYPRLSPGGIIINDDYLSPNFPGGGKAWDIYCAKHNIPFVKLDTGQAVIIK